MYVSELVTAGLTIHCRLQSGKVIDRPVRNLSTMLTDNLSRLTMYSCYPSIHAGVSAYLALPRQRHKHLTRMLTSCSVSTRHPTLIKKDTAMIMTDASDARWESWRPWRALKSKQSGWGLSSQTTLPSGRQSCRRPGNWFTGCRKHVSALGECFDMCDANPWSRQDWIVLEQWWFLQAWKWRRCQTRKYCQAGFKLTTPKCLLAWPLSTRQSEQPPLSTLPFIHLPIYFFYYPCWGACHDEAHHIHNSVFVLHFNYHQQLGYKRALVMLATTCIKASTIYVFNPVINIY